MFQWVKLAGTRDVSERERERDRERERERDEDTKEKKNAAVVLVRLFTGK